MGGSSEHLQAAFDTVSAELEHWTPPAISISDDKDLFNHLGDKEYQHAFLVYFDRRLSDFNGDWKALLVQYLLEGDKPLLSGTIGGFAHPLILLSDAIELADAKLAVEALALTAVDYNPLHALLEAPLKPAATTIPALDVLQNIKSDSRFDGLLDDPGVGNTNVILKSAEARSALVEHFNSFNYVADSPEKAAEITHELTRVAILLLVAIYPPGKHDFDFYLTHQLTFAWCLRILIPALPTEATPVLLREVWLLMVLTYLTQLRPAIDTKKVSSVTVKPEAVAGEWDRLNEVGLGASKDKGMDPHFVKVIRNLREDALLWPEDEMMFLSASILFESEFSGWGGFGKGV